MVSKTISVIGGLDYDLIMIANRIPDGGESLVANNYHEALGGKGANSAISAYRSSHIKPQDEFVPDSTVELGYRRDHEGGAQPRSPKSYASHRNFEINVRMVGAVGDDKYGERLHDEMRNSGVDCSGLVTIPNTESSICFVMVEAYTRQNRCLFARGATATWRKEHFQTAEQLGLGVRPDLCVAQMEIEKEVVEQMIETAGKADIDFVLNAAPANHMSKRTYHWITHLLVNESEAAVLSGRDLNEVNKANWSVICEEFLQRGAKNVVITLGAKGAFYANAITSGHCPAYKVNVVDTTGAGDTFTGAYSSSYLQQRVASAGKSWDIKTAVIRANKAAAMTVMELGAQAGIPWSDEIDSFDAPFREPDMSGHSISEDHTTV